MAEACVKVGISSRGMSETPLTTGLRAAAQGMLPSMVEAKPDIRQIRGRRDSEALQYPRELQAHNYQKLNDRYGGKPFETYGHHLIDPEPRKQCPNAGQNEDDE